MAISSNSVYWHEMKNKAAHNLAGITHMEDIPTTEDEAKDLVAYAMRHGTYAEAACAIGEYTEFIMSHLMLSMSPRPIDFPATVGA